jgi:hypothetical protein
MAISASQNLPVRDCRILFVVLEIGRVSDVLRAPEDFNAFGNFVPDGIPVDVGTEQYEATTLNCFILDSGLQRRQHDKKYQHRLVLEMMVSPLSNSRIKSTCMMNNSCALGCYLLALVSFMPTRIVTSIGRCL